MGEFQTSLEQRLEKQIVPVFLMLGQTPEQARTSFAKLLKEVKEEATKEGSINTPTNSGDLILQQEQSVERIRLAVARLRSEGVTDRDIRTWWNQSDIERRLALKLDETPRGATYITCRKQGLMPDEAAKEVWKTHAMYGDPNDTSRGGGDDRPLPVELRQRINDFIQSKWMNRAEQFKASTNQYSSMNAWIRTQMRAGLL